MATHGAIILSDGDVPSLACLVHAAEASLADRSGGGVGSSDLLLCPTVDRGPECEAALRRQAASNGAELLSPLAAPGSHVDLLIAAGRLAKQRGVSRVIWPAHAGVEGEPDAIDVARCSALADTSMLIERLLEIESEPSPAIELPFVDLSDRQVADLAIDLGQIPGEVWWTGRSADAQLRAAERWSSAFEAAGVPLRPSVRAATGRG